MLKKLREFTDRKKSIVVIVAMMLLGAAQMYLPFQIPNEVWVFLFGLLGITYKDGQNRVENATKELLESIKEQNILLKK